MSLFTIAFKSIRQRALASSLTGFSVALGVMLMVSVLVMYGIVERMFSQRSVGYHLIVGPKGSDLQLVLNTIYRVSQPIENLPYLYYLELKEMPGVKVAVPVALGDVTEQGAFPIVGTTGEYFTNEYAPGRKFRIRSEVKGTAFRESFDAIIGSQVARQNKWDIGTQFTLIHGGAESDHVHDEKFTVQGVLAPTGTPNDKTVFVQLNGFYAIAGHDKPLEEAVRRWREFNGLSVDEDELAAAVVEWKKKLGVDESDSHDHHGHHHHATPDIQKEVTAVLLLMENDSAAFLFGARLKKGFKAQAVNPILPMRRLMQDILGNVRTALVVLTGLIVVVSVVGIFVSIYNSMSDRRKEIATMRALGAQRQTVFAIIVAEAVLLCLAGGVLGMLLGHGLVYVAAPYVESQSGILIDPLAFETAELAILPVLIVLAAVAGIVPGMTAYRTDVAKALAD